MSKVAQSLAALRDLPDEELRQQLAKTQDELFRLKLGQYTNQVTSTAGVVRKRRDIARALTVLRGRALGIDRPAGSGKSLAGDKAGAGEAQAQQKAPAAAKTSKPKVSKKS